MSETQSYHQEGCDGYAIAHYGRIEHIPPDKYKASCYRCAWVSQTVRGDALKDIVLLAEEHTELVACTGQCKGSNYKMTSYEDEQLAIDEGTG